MHKGNKKSAQMQDKKLQKSISQDVKVSHLLPIPLEIVEEIPEVCVASLGMEGQWSFNEKGEREQKMRVTHNLSQEHPSGNSINN